MLPQRYRRLWCRRLRRRPLLPFLLAATVAVDLVIASLWLQEAPDSVVTTAFGLLDAHLLLAAIYLAAGEGPLIVRVFVALLAAAGFGVLEGNPTSETGFIALSVLLVEAAACALALRFLPSTRRAKKWRTRILSLMAWSVAVAVVSLWIRESQPEALTVVFRDQWVWFQVCSQALLAVTTLTAARLIRDDWHACVVVAVVVALIISFETIGLGAPVADSLLYRTTTAAGVMLWLLGLRFERVPPPAGDAVLRDQPPAEIDLQA